MYIIILLFNINAVKNEVKLSILQSSHYNLKKWKKRITTITNFGGRDKRCT